MQIIFAGDFQWLAFGVFLVLALVLNTFLLKSLLFNLFDPLWLIIFGTASTLAWLGYEFWMGRVTAEIMTYLVSAQVAFALGARGGKFVLQSVRHRSIHGSPVASTRPGGWEAGFVRTFLLVSTGVISILFVLRAYFLGLGLLSEDPEAARVLANQGGFGLIGRIAGPLIFGNLILLFYSLRARLRLSPLVLMLYFSVPAMYILFLGSKSGFIAFFFDYYFANVYVSLREGKPLAFVSARTASLAVLSVLGFAMVILYLRAPAVTTDPYGMFAAQQLVMRILGTGQGPAYYFTENLSAVMRNSPPDYFWDYVVVPFLAPARLVPYPSHTLGSELGHLMAGGESLFGPNPTMFVEGWVFFGVAGGVVYCFVLGVLLASLRYWGSIFKLRSNLLQLLGFCVSNSLLLAVPGDMVLVGADLFNYLCFLVPTVLVCALVTSAVLQSRADHPRKVSPPHTIGCLGD